MVTPTEDHTWQQAADVATEGNVSALVRATMNSTPAVVAVREAKAAE